MINFEDLNMKKLEKMAFFVDFLPKNLKFGLLFQMSGLVFMHVKDKKCILVLFEEDEQKDLPFA